MVEDWRGEEREGRACKAWRGNAARAHVVKGISYGVKKECDGIIDSVVWA